MNPNTQLVRTGGLIPTKAQAELHQALLEYIGSCTARGSASARTKAAYGTAIDIFMEWCREHALDPRQAQMKDIENWRGDMLAAGSSAGTVMLRLSAIRTLYKALRRAGGHTGNPAEYVKSPRPTVAPVDAVMRKIIFPDQMIVVLGKLEDDYRGRRDRVILLTLYLLGLRVSEVAGLSWEDWKGDTLAFRAKGGLARELSIPEALKLALANLRTFQPEPGPIFLGVGGRLTVRAIQKMVAARLEAAGLQRLSPHAMRHSCATVAAIGAASPYAIQKTSWGTPASARQPFIRRWQAGSWKLQARLLPELWECKRRLIKKVPSINCWMERPQEFFLNLDPTERVK